MLARDDSQAVALINFVKLTRGSLGSFESTSSGRATVRYLKMRGPPLQWICRTTFAPLTVTVDMTHFMFYRKVIDVALLAARLHEVSPPPLADGYRGS